MERSEIEVGMVGGNPEFGFDHANFEVSIKHSSEGVI